MRALIGSTGFVGAGLSLQVPFDISVHRTDLNRLDGGTFDEIVCAGLPAAKYLANADPEADWANMLNLVATLSTVHARRFVLVSTVDVFESPRGVDEGSPIGYAARQAYRRNRAWFEAFVRATFDDHLVVRLPGLFGSGLRKNLVYDLLEGRSEQWANVDAASTFQFFDTATTWSTITTATRAGLRVLNVATEPVAAQRVADLFDVTLPTTGNEVHYDMQTTHAAAFGRPGRYVATADEQLAGIDRLRSGWRSGEVQR